MPVKSSNIKAVKWSASPGNQDLVLNNGVLEIMFNNGTHYAYDGVSEKIYKVLLSSPSVGRAFNELVLRADPAFKATRMPAPMVPDAPK